MLGKTSKAYLIYLGILSAAGGIAVYLATSKQGPGVSTDAAMMLATAENLVKGHGLVDYRGVELTQFPPLYSIILALGSIVFHQEVFAVAWGFQIILYAAVVWFSGLCFAEALADEPILAYMAAFVICSSTSLITIFSNVASDPLFLLLVLFFLMSMAAYLRSHSIRPLILAALLALVACFERYAGLSLVIVGALIVACESRHDLRKLLLRTPIFTVLTGAPIVLWGTLHNAPVNGTVFGGRLPAVPTLNFLTGLEKVLYWFIPLRIVSFVGPLLLTALILGVLILALLALRVKGVFQKLRSPEVIPHVVFLIVYAAVLVFDISYYELTGINTDRVHVILLPSLLVVMLVVGARLLGATKARIGTRLTYGAALVLFLVWTSFPITKTYDYVRHSMASGEASSYNSINKGDIRSSPFALYLMSLDLRDKEVYTNGSDSAWFILHTQIDPVLLIKSGDRTTYLAQQAGHWPGAGKDGYIVWFNGEAYKQTYATPEELSSIAALNKIYSDDEGSIYTVSTRQP